MRGFSIPLALRNLGRRKPRTAAALCITGFSVIALQLIGGLYQNMFDGIEQDMIASQGHLWVEFDTPIENLEADIDSFADQSALFTRWVFRRDVSGLLGTADRSALFSGRVLDPEREADFRSGGSPEALYEIQTGPILAANLSVQPGDALSGFAMDQGFGFSVQRIEPTHSTELDRFYQELPAESFLYDIAYTDVHFQVASDADMNGAAAAIEEFLNQRQLEYTLHSYTDSQSYLSSVRHIYTSNYQFIFIVIAIAVFFTMANTALMASLERRREIGTIRSFGAPESHFHIVLFWESLCTAVLAFAAGTLATRIIGAIINAAGGVQMQPPPTVQGTFSLFYSHSTASMWLSGILVVLVSCVSSQAAILGSQKESIIRQVNS